MKNINSIFSPERRTAVNGLAVIGFIALAAAGVWLAIYSTRFVPTAVNRIGSAAVYLSSIFTSPKGASLSVVPALSSASTTTSPVNAAEATSTQVTSATAKPTQTNWTPGTPVAITNGATSTPLVAHYYGLPDLAVELETVGYMGADGNIVATTTIPAGTQIAVKFRVTNIGTSPSGTWTMNIAIPSAGTFASQTFNSLESLVPSQPSEYIARFDNIPAGANQAIVITIDPNHQLTESNTANNVVSTNVTVLGS
ncbi:hypothetical protein HKL94_00935 [Candidatus Parcubacteria bacterium]|nr:hypothetical protein [Candidatus Parcubacteria bacterium]